MSPVMIAALVIGGVLLLIAIGYINQVVERHKLEKARLKAELNDRRRRCQQLSDSFPGQLMTPALKQLLTRLELDAGEKLLPLDKTDDALQSRLQTLRAEREKGESVEVRNAPCQIVTEAQAKEIRFMLEDLHAQVVRGAKDGVLKQDEAKQWLREIQRLLVKLHIDYFNNLGKQALQQNLPQRARLAFERAVNYIRKQPKPVEYQSQLRQLEAALAHAEALVLRQGTPQPTEPSILAEGMKSFDDDDLWKKNNVY